MADPLSLFREFCIADKPTKYDTVAKLVYFDDVAISKDMDTSFRKSGAGSGVMYYKVEDVWFLLQHK